MMQGGARDLDPPARAPRGQLAAGKRCA